MESARPGRRARQHRARGRPLHAALPRHASPRRHRAATRWPLRSRRLRRRARLRRSAARDLSSAAAGARRAFTWHEAADTTLFRPLPSRARQRDLVWIGNWGDDERSRRTRRIPDRAGRDARAARARFTACAIRSRRWHISRPPASITRGWLPNHRAPQAFARARVTVHVPRRPYVEALPGIPTIRMFEALACGIPLVSAPWNDCEDLFPPDCYLSVEQTARR